MAADLDKLGLEVVSFTLKDVTDESGYIQNMSRPEIARNKQMAEIAEAEMTRNVAIRSAETLRESAQARAKADQERVLAETLSKGAQAESQRDLEIKQAEYLGKVSEQKAQADRAYDIQASITQQKLVEEKTKIDIVQNAIDLAHAVGFPEVRVAILSAMETVNPQVPSTIEAAALCKMADRGQITGAVLDGPLALDNAICPEAAAIKHIVSPVAGRANLLVVPDLEAGNMLAKSLSFLAGADSAGIVLGARVPIILTSRADSLMARLASCAIASLVAASRRP